MKATSLDGNARKNFFHDSMHGFLKINMDSGRVHNNITFCTTFLEQRKHFPVSILKSMYGIQLLEIFQTTFECTISKYIICV